MTRHVRRAVGAATVAAALGLAGPSAAAPAPIRPVRGERRPACLFAPGIT